MVPVYLVFQPADAHPKASLPRIVGSYPAFSPLPFRAVVFFCICHDLAAIFPLRRAVALCCPDFPLSHCCDSDKPVCLLIFMSGKRASNPRPVAWEATALPTELFPHWYLFLRCKFMPNVSDYQIFLYNFCVSAYKSLRMFLTHFGPL